MWTQVIIFKKVFIVFFINRTNFTSFQFIQNICYITLKVQPAAIAALKGQYMGHPKTCQNMQNFDSEI